MTDKTEEYRESDDFLDWAKKQQDSPDFYWKKCFDALDAPAFIMSANGRILICNSAFEKWMSLPAKELTGKKCFPLVHGTNNFIEGCPFVKSRKSHKRETYILKMSERFYQITIDPIFDREGRFAGAVHIFSDIHDMLKTNAERAMLGKVIENSADGIISTDLECRITGWNRGAERMFGYNKEEVMDKSFRELLHDSPDIDIEEIVRELCEKHQIERKDAKFQTKSGEMLNISLGASPVFDEGNDLSGAAFILTDHTKQRQAEINLLSFMTEAVLRLEKPIEMIRTNIVDILDLYKNGDINNEELFDLVSIQITNTDKVLENIIELKKATAKDEDAMPEIMKDFFRQ
ncbi:MAG: PAS domain-containing protein [Methanomicrobiaceae archaeon]|nr:PAS domain-containing protein [Methanomicrobiaceae archaeon]